MIKRYLRLQWLLVSRLILNLKRKGSSAETAVGNIASRLPEPVFAANSFLGNIGAPLRVGDDDEATLEVRSIEDYKDIDTYPPKCSIALP